LLQPIFVFLQAEAVRMAGQGLVHNAPRLEDPLLVHQVPDQLYGCCLVIGISCQEFPKNFIRTFITALVRQRASQFQPSTPVTRVRGQDFPEELCGVAIVPVIKTRAPQFQPKPVVLGETPQRPLEKTDRISVTMFQDGCLTFGQAPINRFACLGKGRARSPT
jgi:hypothetical protein